MTNPINIDVIVVRQHYPHQGNPSSSIWVHEQVCSLKNNGINSVIISPRPFIPEVLKKKLSTSYRPWQNKINEFDDLSIIRPVYLRIPKNKFYGITNYFISQSLAKLSHNINAKLIHAHFGNDGVAAIKLKKIKKIPLVTSFYGFDLSDHLKKLSPYYKELSKEGDLFLALSEDMKSDLENIGFPKEKIITHHLGVDLKKFHSTKNKMKKKNFTFLIVARFSERKGIHDSISAFHELKKKYPDIQLRIIGDGPYEGKLKLLVNSLNLGESIIFINNLKHKDPKQTVIEEIRNCDVFMLTSFETKTGSKEGTPIVLMEAQAMNKPCISTFHAGISEVVINGKTGILVQERNIKEIIIAMESLMTNDELAFSMGLAGRAHIQNNFNQENQAKTLISLYQDVVGKQNW